MFRIALCSIALLGFGAATQAGELDKESATKAPVVKSSFGGSVGSLAPSIPATTPGGSELDRESPADAHHYRGYYGGYRGYGYSGYRGYYGGYRGIGYGGYGYRPYYGGWGYRTYYPRYYGGFGYGGYGGYGGYARPYFSLAIGSPWYW